ncbi:hypothetical protein bpmyx0001_55950 [Bacillus pseudomycoides DSM 12442]|nr:hypothetical protein bpmyx0001_55950 [Bacillus pseudomycoides DSM 12442]
MKKIVSWLNAQPALLFSKIGGEHEQYKSKTVIQIQTS